VAERVGFAARLRRSRCRLRRQSNPAFLITVGSNPNEAPGLVVAERVGFAARLRRSRCRLRRQSNPGLLHYRGFEPHETPWLVCGGEGGIRTHGRLAPTPDFESGTFDHSATSP
jgi:hypothetical protein